MISSACPERERGGGGVLAQKTERVLDPDRTGPARPVSSAL